MWLAIIPWAKKDGDEMNPVMRIFGWFITFNIVCLGWLLFRAEDMQTVQIMLHQIANNFNAEIIPQVVLGYKAVLGLIVLGYLMHFIPKKIDEDMMSKVGGAKFWWQVAMIALTAWCVMQV